MARPAKARRGIPRSHGGANPVGRQVWGCLGASWGRRPRGGVGRRGEGRRGEACD